MIKLFNLHFHFTCLTFYFFLFTFYLFQGRNFMKNVVIVDGLRTPFIKAWTDFAAIPAQQSWRHCYPRIT